MINSRPPWYKGGLVQSGLERGGSRPISRVLSWTVIPLGCPSPDTSSSLPGNTHGPCAADQTNLSTRFPIWPCSERGLPCRSCCQARGALLPHRFTLTGVDRSHRLGGLLSVALSVDFRPPGVTWRSALRSPDFPPTPFDASDCLANSHAHDRRVDGEPQENFVIIRAESPRHVHKWHYVASLRSRTPHLPPLRVAHARVTCGWLHHIA